MKSEQEITAMKAAFISKHGAATPLHDLGSDEFIFGSDLSDIIQAAGSDEYPRTMVNDGNCWSMTVEAFLETVTTSVLD